MSLRCKRAPGDQDLCTRSKGFSWKGREGRKNRSRRSRSLVLTGSTSTTDSGYTSERSDVDTLRGQRSRRTSTSSTASRASYMPNVCYHCQIAESNGAISSSAAEQRCDNIPNRCFRANDYVDTLESIPKIDHSPYASLRQLFYGKEQQNKSSRTKVYHDKQSPVTDSPVLLAWRQVPSPMPDNNEVKLRNQGHAMSRRRRKAIHLSLYGTPTYADLHIPPPGDVHEPPRGNENNRPSSRSKVRRRTRSYDPSKFERLLSSDGADRGLVNKENQVGSCQGTYYNESRGSNLNEMWKERLKSMSVGTHEKIQRGDSVFATVPWIKRQSAAVKRSKRTEKSDGRFLSSFFDKLRAGSKNVTEPAFNLVDKPLISSLDEDTEKLFGRTALQLTFLRSRLSEQNRTRDWICDGRFGCSEKGGYS